MRRILSIAPVALLACFWVPARAAAGAEASDGGRGAPADPHAVLEEIRLSSYEVSRGESGGPPNPPAAYRAANRVHDLRIYFAPEGPTVLPLTAASIWEKLPMTSLWIRWKWMYS